MTGTASISLSTPPLCVASFGLPHSTAVSGDSQTFYVANGFSKTDKKRQELEGAGFLSVKLRNWHSMTSAII